MRGLTITFDEQGAEINFDKVGDQYLLTQQRAVITFAATTNSDKIFPEKGSNILNKGVTNVIYDIWSARKEAALISLDVLNFITTNNDVPLTDRIVKLAFTPIIERLQFLNLTTTVEFESGVTLTSNSDINL